MTIDSGRSEVNLSACFYYSTADYADPSQLPQQPEDHPQWHAIRSDSINLGFQTASYWFVCDFITKKLNDHQWMLSQSYSLVDHLDVYFYQDGSQVSAWKTGDRLLFRQRPIAHEDFIFPVTLESESRYRLIVKATNSEAMELPLKLYEVDTFWIKDRQKAVINGIFFGFLIIMAAYNWVLYLNIREKSYLYYVLYVAGMLFYFLSQDGVVYHYFLADSPILHHFSIPLIIVFTAHCIVMFVHTFLELEKRSPMLWRVIRWLVALNLIVGLSFFFVPYRLGILAMCAVLGLLCIMGLAVTTRLSLQGIRTAKILLAGWGFLLLFIIIMLLSKVGVVYNEFIGNYGIKMGTTLEVLIFSFALSYRINLEKQEKEQALQRINDERRERIEAQASALRYEEEAHQAKDLALQQQRELNEKLEHLVGQRTRQLEETLKHLEQSNRELEILGETDSLTKLYNRRALEEKALLVWQKSLQSGDCFSLLLIDADHFKAVNDTRGHPCGDYVLIELANIIQNTATRPSDLAFRYGGEEFLLILPNTSAEGALRVAELVRELTQSQPMVWQGSTFGITVSIGVHTSTGSAQESIETIIAQADAALYHSKQTGRNKVTISTELIEG